MNSNPGQAVTFDSIIGHIRNFKPAAIIPLLPLLLMKIVKSVVIYRIAKGLLMVVGIIFALSWIGFDFNHVLDFFGAVPEITNLDGTWIGDVYNAVFKLMVEFVQGIAEQAPPPPDGQKLLDALKNVITGG